MTECSSCGTELNPHEIRCPTCDKPTAYYHRQRRCLHCGTPAAEQAKTCVMCGQPVDSLPLSTSVFSGSWIGIGLGLLIIALIVLGIVRYQWNLNKTVAAAQPTSPPSTYTPSPTITPTPGPTDTSTPTATATPTATPTPRTHIVESGENPSYIASLYGITVDELIALNNIDDVSSLSVGQALILPSPIEEVDASEEQTQSYLESPLQIVYVIESGDTLLDIALEYGTSIEAILALNPDVDTDLVYPGQNIVVPLATPTATATPTITPTSTPTSGPLYPPPSLLMPAENEVVDGSVLLFNWTATGLLADDDYYVLQLVWADGSYTEHWVKSSSWRIAKEERLAAGPLSWRVAVMQQTGFKPDGSPAGIILTEPIGQRTVVWP